MPPRVEASNQPELLRSRPAFDPLLALDRRVPIVGFLVIHQLVDVVALGKPFDEPVSVLVDAALETGGASLAAVSETVLPVKCVSSSLEVARHTHIEGAFAAGEDVDPVPLHALRSSVAHPILRQKRPRNDSVVLWWFGGLEPLFAQQTLGICDLDIYKPTGIIPP